MEPTKARLARVLREADLVELAALAERGQFSDFESPHDLPKVELVKALQKAKRMDLAQRVMGGEFDDSREEAEAWFQREGRTLLR